MPPYWNGNYYTTNSRKVNTQFWTFREIFGLFQQQPQNFIIRKGRMGISSIQNGFYIVDIILDLLREQLGSPENITAQMLDQQAGQDDKLHTAIKVIIGNCLQPVPLDQISCQGTVMAGTVLAFARALGEYGATSMLSGYTPGRTATISTTVYQLWRTNDDAAAFRWVLVNLAISFVVLLAVNLLEKRAKPAGKAGAN